jgi:hypothetical protein
MAEAPLTGWKEIAAFIGSSVRTVQRFERDFGLPIRRTQLSKGAVVRAYPSELAKWLDDRPSDAAGPTLAVTAGSGRESHPDAPSAGAGRRTALIAGAALSLALIGVWAWHSAGRAQGEMRGNSEAAALGHPESAPPVVGAQTKRVSLTIRPGLGSPFRIAGPAGGLTEISLGPGLDLGLRPTFQGRELILEVDRRRQPDGGLESVATVRMSLGATERVDVNGISLDITWNAQPTVQQ